MILSTKTTINKSQRDSSLDALKGICILFVLITHFSWLPEERLKYLFPFYIDMAVPIFMIISGYVYSLSFKNKSIVSFENAYSFSNIKSKLIRYSIPFIIVFVFEEIIFFVKNSFHFSFSEILSVVLSFLSGGSGPGSYYYPILIQLVFIFPIIYFIIKRYHFKGVIICGLFNCIFEILQLAYNMNEECYRLLIFRYVLLLSIGCYLALYDELKSTHKLIISIISCIIGFTFILSYFYLGYEPIILRYWTKTSILAVLYIIPFICLFIRKGKVVKFFPLEIIGKASYHDYFGAKAPELSLPQLR